MHFRSLSPETRVTFAYYPPVIVLRYALRIVSYIEGVCGLCAYLSKTENPEVLEHSQTRVLMDFVSIFRASCNFEPVLAT
eukprot:2960446-Prymnesium_polylepis.1